MCSVPANIRTYAIRSPDGPRSIFALNTALLDQSLAALQRDGDFGDAAFDRGDLAATLTLLANLGAIDYDGATVALPRV